MLQIPSFSSMDFGSERVIMTFYWTTALSLFLLDSAFSGYRYEAASLLTPCVFHLQGCHVLLTISIALMTHSALAAPLTLPAVPGMSAAQLLAAKHHHMVLTDSGPVSPVVMKEPSPGQPLLLSAFTSRENFHCHSCCVGASL